MKVKTLHRFPHISPNPLRSKSNQRLCSHEKSEEDIRGNLDLARGVDDRVAGLGPEVPLVVAGDEMVELEHGWLPPPEPSVTNTEDDGGDTEDPGEEVGADFPARVEGFVEEEEGEGEGVED